MNYDITGTEIKVGDKVAYARSTGRTAYMEELRVTAIDGHKVSMGKFNTTRSERNILIIQ
jgi:hypothetical protein